MIDICYKCRSKKEKTVNIVITRIVILLFPFIPIIVFGQVKRIDCKRIHTGTFYYYPIKSKQPYIIIRNSLFQKEIDINKKDTSVCRISWQNDCTFSSKIIKSTLLQQDYLKDFLKDFFKSHSMVIEIVDIEKDYYIFKQGVDVIKINARMDTIWFKPKKLFLTRLAPRI